MPDTFVYSLCPVFATYTLAAISSDDFITFFIAQSTNVTVTHSIKNAHAGISCLAPYDADGNYITTAGRDGRVKLWRVSDGSPTGEWRTPNGEGISAIACHEVSGIVAGGTELEKDGPGDVAIYLWSAAHSGQGPIRYYADSHTDTITSLCFSTAERLHTRITTYLLSASTDGLITVFDAGIDDEDEAVVAVLPNTVPVSHAQLVQSREVVTSATSTPYAARESPKAVLAISHDERLSVHEFTEAKDDDETAVEVEVDTARSAPIDLRSQYGCDYAVGLKTWVGGNSWASGLLLAVGACKSETATEPHLDMLLSTDNSLGFVLMGRLIGAHQDEVVRDIWVDREAQLVVTCGEDGHVRVWTGADESMGEDPLEAGDQAAGTKNDAKLEKGRKSKSRARFKPY